MIDRGFEDPFVAKVNRSGVSTVRVVFDLLVCMMDVYMGRGCSPQGRRYDVSFAPLKADYILPDMHIYQVPETRIAQALEQASLQQDLNRSLLRITSILQQCEYCITSEIHLPTKSKASRNTAPKQP